MTKQNNQLATELQPLSGQRQKSESDSAVVACNDWLRMGSGRKLVDLLKHYQDLSNFSATFEPPTLSVPTLQTWSSKYNWSDRATEYDASWEQRKNAEREQVFNHELAQDFGRVRKLLKLAQMLEAQIYEVGTSEVQVDLDTFEEVKILHNVWLPDVKQIGSGDSAERVDIERFNSALISEYRATLDDLAKEVGGRKQKTEITGAGGGAIQTQQTNVNIQAENAHDASNILKQLADLGAIPSPTGDSGHNTETE